MRTRDVHWRVRSLPDQCDVLVSAFFHSDALSRCQRVLDLLGQAVRWDTPMRLPGFEAATSIVH